MLSDPEILPDTGSHRSSLDLRHPSLYLNRELSWLEFNRRVLHEALDPRTPLLERVRFLAIFSNNLDEFFQVRVAGLKHQVAAHLVEKTADGLTAEEQLRAIAATVRGLQARHEHCLLEEVLPALAAEGVALLIRWTDLTATDRKQVAHYFDQHVFPVLTPLAVDPAHPFPYISNLSISLAVVLRDEGGEERFARVKVPRILPRWVPLPGANRFILLERVIIAHLDSLFPGVEILGAYCFRITRDTDMEIDAEDADDLLSLIQEEVHNRRFAEVVRLELEAGTPDSLRELLLEELNADQVTEGILLTEEDVYPVHGFLDASDLSPAAGLDLPTLKDAPHSPVVPQRLAAGRDIFEVIREGDVLLHHPYESFTSSVERFIEASSHDPDVLAIKITLYRTGTDSNLPRLLTQAAERGKQVAVLIELQARFDEESNIAWARRFEDAGVHVSYGVSGLKTHTKVMLVVRREGDQLRRYVHIGTGNYAPRTAKLYTDFGLLSCDPALGADLSDLFNVLTGFASPPSYRQIIVAPRGLRPRLRELVQRETAHAAAGRPARILAKMNSLVDPEVIQNLYEASQAGVTVDLIVRGICCLRPGLPGISDRVRVISIIGRFLEHSRAWHFANDGDPEAFIGSADWMPRNLDRRIEAVVPIRNPKHLQELLTILELMWTDNRQAWDLRPDGTYVQRVPGLEPERASHRMLIERYAGREK
ncbi:MAG: polyphosphate kinase 1 [Gemmatimonadota bacterium]|nr:polyphosphate kinase 1 [Gemmatimonadota bacterium]